MEKTSLEIVQMAFERDEVDKLLLGEPPYTLPPNRFSVAPQGIITDFDRLESGLYKYKRKTQDPSIELKLMEALKKIADTSLGILTTAIFILDQAIMQKDGLTPLTGLNLSALAVMLQYKIQAHKHKLENEKELYGGDNFPNGLYGFLKKLSEGTQKHGGPGFV